jgi:hypothetical protein
VADESHVHCSPEARSTRALKWPVGCDPYSEFGGANMGTEVHLGECTISIGADSVRLTRHTAHSDCAHTVAGEGIAKVCEALGIDVSMDVAAYLWSLGPSDAARLHDIFMATATENFAWWDPDDMSRV